MSFTTATYDLRKISRRPSFETNIKTTNRIHQTNTVAPRFNMFNCAVCLEKKDGSGIRVAAHYRVCVNCVKEYVMPKFHAALKYEAQWPPMWGEGIELEPKDFLIFFDKPSEFIQKYEKREQEYNTPIKARFYCSACGEFLCTKPKDKEKITFNAHCADCGEFTCWPCGANVTGSSKSHVCAPKPAEEQERTNPFQGLEVGKDYQLCPNSDCELPVELRDGCNHMQCTSCQTQFCFICGAELAGAHSGHWDYGSACTRWNHPEEPGARHDNAELNARPRAALGEQREIDEMARRMGVEDDDEEVDVDDIWVPFDLLFEDIGRAAYERLVQNLVPLMNDLPALPDLTGMTNEQQIRAEGDMADELLSSTLGQLMLRQQRELDAMLEVVEAHTIEADNEDLPRPDWVGVAQQLMEDLRRNLYVYIRRVDVRIHLVEFEAFHDGLEAAYGPHQIAIYRRFPRFYEILVQYMNVAEIRMLGATSALEGDATEDEVTREEVADFLETLRRNGEIDEVLEDVADLQEDVRRNREIDEALDAARTLLQLTREPDETAE